MPVTDTSVFRTHSAVVVLATVLANKIFLLQTTFECSSQTNMTVASTACPTYLCILGVLFLILEEEEEEGVARGAVFLGTTFSSLYRVVGESGTWRKTRDKGRNTHLIDQHYFEETLSVASIYNMN